MASPTERALETAGQMIAKALHNAEASDQFERPVVMNAVVQTRQDVAGVFGMTVAIHGQLVAISRGVWVLVAIAAVAALKWLL